MHNLGKVVCLTSDFFHPAQNLKLDLVKPTKQLMSTSKYSKNEQSLFRQIDFSSGGTSLPDAASQEGERRGKENFYLDFDLVQS